MQMLSQVFLSEMRGVEGRSLHRSFLHTIGLVGSFGAGHLLFNLGTSLSFLLNLTIFWQFAWATREPAVLGR